MSKNRLSLSSDMNVCSSNRLKLSYVAHKSGWKLTEAEHQMKLYGSDLDINDSCWMLQMSSIFCQSHYGQHFQNNTFTLYMERFLRGGSQSFLSRRVCKWSHGNHIPSFMRRGGLMFLLQRKTLHGHILPEDTRWVCGIVQEVKCEGISPHDKNNN